jgi:putative DNA primase/helicase
VNFDPDAPPPRQWFNFLDQIFEDDNEAKQLLQEWFGYLLSADTSQQKIMLIVGPKRSGKGTTGRIHKALLGQDSVAGPTMSSLGELFGLEPLITKTSAIISDARIGKRSDKSVITERLLSISGEDTLEVHRKYNKAWEGTLPTRITILTNPLPSLNDESGALAGRFIILVMTKSFFGREDTSLTTKLSTELPGILNWSIEGYRRLQRRGYFVQPQSSLDAAEEIEMLAAPVKAFVRDCCEVGPGLWQSTDDLWAEWKRWSEDQGRSELGTKIWFGRNLRSAEPGLKPTKKEVEGSDHRKPGYRGIALKDFVPFNQPGPDPGAAFQAAAAAAAAAGRRRRS